MVRRRQGTCGVIEKNGLAVEGLVSRGNWTGPVIYPVDLLFCSFILCVISSDHKFICLQVWIVLVATVLFHLVFCAMAMHPAYANLTRDKRIRLARRWLKSVVDNGLLNARYRRPKTALPPKVVKIEGEDVWQFDTLREGPPKKDRVLYVGSISGDSARRLGVFIKQCLLHYSKASMSALTADQIQAYYHGPFVEFVAEMHGVDVLDLEFPRRPSLD